MVNMTTTKKINYFDESLKEYKNLRSNNKEIPNLLLHVCCGACSAFPLIYLIDLFNITIYFSNSNIYPLEEFNKRKEALEKYVDIINKKFNKNIKIIVDNYNYEEFKKDLIPFKDEKEGLNRCKICISKRLNRLFEYAKDNNYSLVSTVMSVSRNKDVYYINEVGKSLEDKYNNIKFLVFDFKKFNGQDIGVAITKNTIFIVKIIVVVNFQKEVMSVAISVVIPIHNAEVELERCLKSVLEQSFELNYEVLCILDGSNTKTYQIVQDFYQEYPRKVKIFETNFFDPGLVRNFGIEQSQGEYIFFVDGDDFLEEECLEDLYNKANKSKAEVVIGNYYNFYPKINKRRTSSFLRNFLSQKTILLKKLLTKLLKIFEYVDMYGIRYINAK